MSSRPPKRQRTTSTTADETPPSTPSTAGLKARVSRGDDAADLKSLLHTISTCRAKANGYNFFHPPAFCDPPEHNDENVAYVTFKCKTPTCSYSTKRLITSAPSAHLYSHGFRCAQDKGKAVEHLSDTPAWEGMGKLEGRKVLQQFALWCACNGCPFGITDDDKLPRLLDEVARRHRPSASAISVAVNDLSDFCATEVRSLLDRAYGAIYLALEAWTAPNGVEVLGVLAFFKTKAGTTELLEHVVPLDFIILVNTHSGEVSPEWCVMGIASDNASNMGCMMDELGEYGLGKDKGVRCWGHILNLVVTGEDPSVEDQHQSLNTRVVWFSDDDTAEDAPIEKKRPGRQTKPAEPKGKDRGAREWQAAADARFVDTTDRAVEDIYREVHVRVESRGHGEDEEEVDCWPTREEMSSDRYTRSSTKWTINKAQKVAERCRYNRTIRIALFTLSNSSTPRPPHPHSIYPAVKTRWNSRTRQFRQIVSHRAQIEKIQTDPKYNIKKENRLNRSDFQLLSDLLKVLEPFEDLTVAFSTRGGGQIEGVLPMIDLLVRHLEGFLNDPNTIPALHNAIILGLEKLFDYYGKTGDCPYYAAAI
ncbi:hypothetical protein JCM1841_006788, partial [Sporobolomyces salmonicolor]